MAASRTGRLAPSRAVQAAVIDGVPGDPNHLGRTVVRLGHSDGALLVGEAGWQEPGVSGPRPGRWGVGAWQYTRKSDPIDGGPPRKNQGVYAVAQSLLVGNASGRTIGFVRAGAANRRVDNVDLALDAGVLVESAMGMHGPRAVTAGLAIAHLGSPSDAGERTSFRNEIAFEIDARWQPLPNLALQPVLQWVRHPGGRAGSAVIAGLRLEWALEPK